jgi:hypothetical protein
MHNFTLNISVYFNFFFFYYTDCVDCNAKYIDACPHHGKDYQIINDSPILSKARMSVPHELNLKPSLVIDCTTGRFDHFVGLS